MPDCEASQRRSGGIGWTGGVPYLAAALVPVIYALVVHSAALDLRPGHELVGLVHTDDQAYYACAREPFDAASGLRYASPYTTDPSAPRIYSHFAFLLIGTVWRVTGISLYALDQSLRVVFGIAMMTLAVALFRRAFPARVRNGPLVAAGGVLLTVGGGLAWAAGAWNLAWDYLFLLGDGSESLPSPNVWAQLLPSAISAAEGGYGEWGASLFRVLAGASECIYHTIFFASVLLHLRGRGGWALFFLFLAWWSHPFTAVELSGVTIVFLLFQFLLGRRGAGRRLVLACAIAGAGLTYYLLFLPRFPEHASVERQMREFGNIMLFNQVLPAYGLLAPLGAGWILTRDFRRSWRRDFRVRLMSAWLAAVVLLVFHDRLPFPGKPIQPLHFSRGYLYVPLTYFAVRGLLLWTGRLRPVRPASLSLFARPAVTALLLVAAHLPDNLVFLGALRERLPKMGEPFSVPAQTMATLRKLRALPATLSLHPVGSVAAQGLSSLIPVLTHHRSLLPHLFNTPFRREKVADAEDFRRSCSYGLLKRWKVDALVVAPGEKPCAPGHPARDREMANPDAF